ncbi:vegetative cell wall protein gp1-like [Panicum virgatum]|uniref:vegetative cell wall protein gp1-like n=1 Tax=Panicum virgatum TaxID=38727 RepID=UPI0019D5F6AD|nr:vegetative cell wall protein gp1-like [Panicum virgatum]
MPRKRGTSERQKMTKKRKLALDGDPQHQTIPTQGIMWKPSSVKHEDLEKLVNDGLLQPQNHRLVYRSKPPLPEYLTAEQLKQHTKNSDLVPLAALEAVLEMMENKMMDFSARHPGDEGQGGSGIKPNASEEPAAPSLSKKTRSAPRTVPSTNLPQFEIPTTTQTNYVADKTPKVEEGAAGTSVAPPPEVPISATMSPPRPSTEANVFVPLNKPSISYVYSSRKNKAPVVPPSPSTEPAVSPTRASASDGEDRGAPTPSFPSSPAPEKVNPDPETPAAAWPQSAKSSHHVAAHA